MLQHDDRELPAGPSLVFGEVRQRRRLLVEEALALRPLPARAAPWSAQSSVAQASRVRSSAVLWPVGKRVGGDEAHPRGHASHPGDELLIGGPEIGAKAPGQHDI